MRWSGRYYYFFFRLGGGEWKKGDGERWTALAVSVCSHRCALDVYQRARYMLRHGTSSYEHAAATWSPATSPEASAVSPREVGGENGRAVVPSLSLPSNATERSTFKAQREPRVTVWDPSTGRTVSGNAAPCKRNLKAWIAAHPGWEVKRDEYLSSSRRGKKLFSPEAIARAAAEMESPVLSYSSVRSHNEPSCFPCDSSPPIPNLAHLCSWDFTSRCFS